MLFDFSNGVGVEVDKLSEKSRDLFVAFDKIPKSLLTDICTGPVQVSADIFKIQFVTVFDMIHQYIIVEL